MILEELCPPALLYIAFSLTQIIIDIFKSMYNTAFFKLIVMIIFTIILNVLCKRGLGVISWFIVFMPFIMMTVITALLLYVFGLSPFTGKLSYDVQYPQGPQIPLQPGSAPPPPQGQNMDGNIQQVGINENKYVGPRGNSITTYQGSRGNSAIEYEGNEYEGGIPTPNQVNNYN